MWVDWEIAIVVSLSFWFIARQQVIDNPSSLRHRAIAVHVL
jgi:hypothetical protein